MNKEQMKQQGWLKKNWKWLVPVSGLAILFSFLFFSSGMDKISADLVQAYADTELYENALNKARSNQKVTNLLGDIESIDNLAILEGEVRYTNDNQTVHSTIRIMGKKAKARMDIIADRINNEWMYKKIDIRIKNPPEQKQTIEIIKSE